MWPKECRMDAFLFLVSCSGHPSARSSVWLCLHPAKLEPVEFLHGVAGVPSGHGAGRQALAEPLVTRKTSEFWSLFIFSM